MPVDPVVYLAFELGRERSDISKLPVSLRDRAARARLVQEIDPPLELISNPLDHDIARAVAVDGQRVLAMARLDPRIVEIAARLIPDVTDERARLSICLRLWAGCLDGAKIISPENRSGPNTPDSRARAHAGMVPGAAVDPIYAAGAEAAVAFKQLRTQPTCFDGIPAVSILRRPSSREQTR